MDEKDFKTRSTRLERVAKVIEKLPPEVRSEAFDLLKAYVTEQASDSPGKKTASNAKHQGSDDSEESFFRGFDLDKPADNARLIAAYFYREYGAEPFSMDEVRRKADDVGITVPARLDMTFQAAKEKGKKLFARAGRSKFKPTVHGEANLKTTYSVKKGTKKRAEST
ncbi:MAG TPA: hypothetical protein VJR90_00430 [Gammaproteobacteria bacterium]|nr:hypothetical protein [Gammaproteobacteria bacterium]